MRTPEEIHKDSRDLAFKRYDAVLRYLIYENTVYWTRSSFFLAANAGLFGFIASKLPYSPREILGAQGAVVAAGCLAGLLLSVLWHWALASGEYWIKRWENICLSLEAEAFGEIEIWRNSRPAGRDTGKRVTHQTATLFTALWSLALAYVAILMCLKCFTGASSDPLPPLAFFLVCSR